ncbi:MAG: fumarylacetoacetase [Candidatus Puniceispirillaceae bacterium]
MTKRLDSWVKSANSADTDFPLNNLPYGVFSAGNRQTHCGVAIGDYILDVTDLEAQGVFDLSNVPLFSSGSWNRFMALGKPVWARFRKDLTAMLAQGSEWEASLSDALIPMESVHLHLPFQVTEFTDFYASIYHATNVGTMFRGAENALPPNWLHMPIGYNGRASSVVVSGTDISRPYGQIKSVDSDMPRFAASAKFDFELELGAVIGQSSDGHLSVDQAYDNIFGYVLLNDWSARDIQAWEYQPLGPFQAKATATTISPWIVTSEALAPFRVATPPRDYELLDHLKDTEPMLYDIELDIHLITPDGVQSLISKTNYKQMYYSSAQQLAHHSSCGCPMRVGDLLGSGTISGPDRNSHGSMLELSWNADKPVRLSDGSERSFLHDGDIVQMQGAAKGSDYRIGFGICEGKILSGKAR